MEEVLIQKTDKSELLWGARGVMPCASLLDGGPFAGTHSRRRRRRSARGLICRVRIPAAWPGAGSLPAQTFQHRVSSLQAPGQEQLLQF